MKKTRHRKRNKKPIQKYVEVLIDGKKIKLQKEMSTEVYLDKLVAYLPEVLDDLFLESMAVYRELGTKFTVFCQPRDTTKSNRDAILGSLNFLPDDMFELFSGMVDVSPLRAWIKDCNPQTDILFHICVPRWENPSDCNFRNIFLRKKQ